MLANIQFRTFVFSSGVYKRKNLNVQNYKFACGFYGFETWSLTLMEEHRLKVQGAEYNIWTKER
jgi:hypothetical protein